ncbi:hypothetical protein [Paenibacillus turicensis]|uniref:hypothetical protein n=1 Tax=Paenibacillus turicensis TaxID=160487 RepID=UPI001AE705DC|nr:hypothetical protein [Paenibacillus turicensis]
MLSVSAAQNIKPIPTTKADILGMEHSFSKKEKSMTVSRNDKTLTFCAGKKQFKVNT